MKVFGTVITIAGVLTLTTLDRVRADISESRDEDSSTADTCHVASEEASPSPGSGSTTSVRSSPHIESVVVGTEPFGSTVLVWDDFLDPTFLESLYETYLGNATTEWKPVIPHHQQAYKTAASFITEENPLFRAPSEAPGNGGFPGLRANLTYAYHEALHQKILDELPAALIHSVIGSPIANDKLRWSSIDSFFGNLCYHPDSLSLDQKLPHIDQGFVERRPVQLAMVHYLSPSFAGQGGTAFYAETASGGNRFRYRDCQALKEKASEMGFRSGTTAFIKAASCHCKPQNLACTKYQWYIDQVTNTTNTLSPSYASDTTEWCQLLHHVPYRYNRAVLYDARQLHSAFVDQDTLNQLTCDATRGRLTANVFFG